MRNYYLKMILETMITQFISLIIVLGLAFFLCGLVGCAEPTPNKTFYELQYDNYHKFCAPLIDEVQKQILCGEAVYKINGGFLLPRFKYAQTQQSGVETDMVGNCEIVTRGLFLNKSLCIINVHGGTATEEGI